MKTYCSHCGRETYESKKARKARIGAPITMCLAPDEDGLSECIGFTAGRRAAFKEVLKLAKVSMSHAYGLDEFKSAIRAALRVKS